MSKTGFLGVAAIAAVGMWAASAQADDGSYCREYQQRVTIGGTVHNTYGTACMQPDGSWKIVTPDAGLAESGVETPVQVAQIEPPVVVQNVVYDEPYYVRQPVVYPSIGLNFGWSNWDGPRGGGWHGGGHGGGWHHR